MNDTEEFKEACAVIGLEFFSHIGNMVAENDKWDHCDAHDKARASALYRVAFLEGWAKDDIEDALRDCFYAGVNEHRNHIAELTMEGMQEHKRIFNNED